MESFSKDFDSKIQILNTKMLNSIKKINKKKDMQQEQIFIEDGAKTENDSF